jgi:hypothetical protein
MPTLSRIRVDCKRIASEALTAFHNAHASYASWT